MKGHDERVCGLDPRGGVTWRTSTEWSIVDAQASFPLTLSISRPGAGRSWKFGRFLSRSGNAIGVYSLVFQSRTFLLSNAAAGFTAGCALISRPHSGFGHKEASGFKPYAFTCTHVIFRTESSHHYHGPRSPVRAAKFSETRHPQSLNGKAVRQCGSTGGFPFCTTHLSTGRVRTNLCHQRPSCIGTGGNSALPTLRIAHRTRGSP